MIKIMTLLMIMIYKNEKKEHSSLFTYYAEACDMIPHEGL